ncbi:MAG: hypothetical protein F6K04_22250 [Leptolyngbya sp. SIO4C5]|nr:hypothetical protein [Leptolyngbya sp. SIO4C5]
MEKSQAIQIAARFAEDQGYDTALYAVQASLEGEVWKIHFQRRSDAYKPSPGDFFIVLVDSSAAVVQALYPGK